MKFDVTEKLYTEIIYLLWIFDWISIRLDFFSFSLFFHLMSDSIAECTDWMCYWPPNALELSKHDCG